MDSANLSRRSLLALGGAGVLACAAASTPMAAADPTAAMSGDPWARLVAGNARFAAGLPAHPRQDPAYRRSLVAGQQPFACVLGCADSRVPAELLFDQGLGDLFTVRAVGEVLDDAVVGSIEYAVEHLGVRLVVVIGHSGCGAVKAAVELVHGTSEVTGSVSTVARAIEATVRATPEQPDFLAACVRNQASRVAEELPRRSSLLHDADIVPAVYDLASGLVRRH
ncbi:MAG: carbonic anhydrase [Actinophytocola sp.]|uniref:carbonic anhydrase n=1 Tax=Actinophytocola sp. TaxID=1872138 RepID=UPI003D6C6032